MIERHELYIDGKWSTPHSSDLLDVISPSTEQLIGRVPVVVKDDIDDAVNAARNAFDSGVWPRMSVLERANTLRTFRNGFASRANELTELVAAEAGLPAKLWARAELALPFLDYFLDLADQLEESELRQGPTANVMVCKEPVGVVAAILPWNSPLGIAAMKVIPALLAGCTVVFKPDPNTPLHAQLLADLFHEAGVPPGVVNIVPAQRDASATLVEHPGVDHVSFTGSTAAGRIVGEACARQLKRCTLELGGKSAGIVLDDVDLEAVLPMLVGSAFMNNGEACILQSRILAPRSRYAEVVETLAAAASGLTVGDPLDLATDIGPLITDAHRTRVQGLVDRSLQKGAKVVVGGSPSRTQGPGWYYQPTILTDVENTMEIAQEEIFGPVVSVIPYDDDAHAIALANGTRYGLSGSVWTSDHGRGLAVASQVRTGNYGINTFGMDPCAPFGGWKQSGLGCELGREGFDEFRLTKSLHLPFDWAGPNSIREGA